MGLVPKTSQSGHTLGLNKATFQVINLTFQSYLNKVVNLQIFLFDIGLMMALFIDRYISLK